MLVVGVDEGDKTAPPKRTPVDLAGLPERVVQIAGMRPDPGIPVHTFSVLSASGNNLGYLFVQVPQSPRAPHMVDGRYYGRADCTNRPLSDAEVERLISQRIAEQRDVLADARAALKPLESGVKESGPSMGDAVQGVWRSMVGRRAALRVISPVPTASRRT